MLLLVIDPCQFTGLNWEEAEKAFCHALSIHMALYVLCTSPCFFPDQLAVFDDLQRSVWVVVHFAILIPHGCTLLFIPSLIVPALVFLTEGLGHPLGMCHFWILPCCGFWWNISGQTSSVVQERIRGLVPFIPHCYSSSLNGWWHFADSYWSFLGSALCHPHKC